MPNMYSVVAGQSQAASLTETNIEVTAPATRIVIWKRLRVSQATHTTSEQYTVRVQDVTTTGTGTAYVPEQFEPGGVAAGSTVEIDSSVEPTYSGTLFQEDAAWNSLTGRDIVYPPGAEIMMAPSALMATKIITPAGTTTYVPSHVLHFAELG